MFLNVKRKVFMSSFIALTFMPHKNTEIEVRNPFFYKLVIFFSQSNKQLGSLLLLFGLLFG